MNSEYIHILIDKYWNCKTSVTEEKELQAFFSSNDIPENLKQYAPLFNYISDQSSATTSSKFEEELFESIEKLETKNKIKDKEYITIRVFAPFLKIAASILLIGGLGLSIFFIARQNNKPQFVETYRDPHAAMKPATLALQMLSEAIQISESASQQTIQAIDELNIDWHTLDSLHIDTLELNSLPEESINKDIE